jgi:hypothetical protein
VIVEVRNYRVTPGRRADFIRFFEDQAVPALRAHGISVLGPMLDLENPNRFLWLRGFPSLAERDRMKKAFYGGPVWLDELESIAMPMLDAYDFAVCETSPGYVSEDFCERR